MTTTNSSAAGIDNQSSKTTVTAQGIVVPTQSSVLSSSSGSNVRSQYVESKIIALDVGDPAVRFLVHSWILRKSAPLFALASKQQPIVLHELDEDLTHTLVHHMYAGTFERKIHYVPVVNFRHSFRVYYAAIEYQLPDLAELAKHEIVQASEGLSIFDILSAAKTQSFATLPEDDVWYAQYLEDAIQKAMLKDPEPFRRPDFITIVEGNSCLLQIVWKTVMSNFAAAPASTAIGLDPASSAETPLAESMLTESEAPTQDSRHQLPSPTESAVDSPATSRDADELQEPKPLYLDSTASQQIDNKTGFHSSYLGHAASSDLTSNDDFGLPDIEPTTIQPEVLKTVAVSPQSMKKPEHVRVDSMVEADAEVPDNSFDVVKHELLKETAPEVTTGNQDNVKKGKKKAKKNKSSIVF